MTVLRLARDLIAVPSRGGIDDYRPVVAVVTGWLHDHGLPATTLTGGDGAPVAVTCEIGGDRPGPAWVLDACLDTAPFGDEAAWTDPPTLAAVRDGWLHGRGSADSKTAVAIFCHVAARLAGEVAGRVALLFDLDEHTGGFGGAKAYFAGRDDVAGVMIGYPGLDALVVGGRGVHRAEVRLHGVAGHSGSRRASPNAVVKAADLVRRLSAAEPGEGGKVSVTAIRGGEGYSVTPDLCVVTVDIRTTPATGDAGRFLAEIVAEPTPGR